MTTHVLTDTRVLTGRSLRHISRSPDTILTTAVTPIALMLLFVYVFGGAIDTGSDESYLDYMLPGILLITIASGIAYTAYRLFLDLQGGIFERFRSMPIARSSVLWGHVLTSLVANLASIGIVIGVALLLGFRTGASVGAWLAVAGILGLFTLSLTWLAENQPVTSIVNTLRALFEQQSPGADIWVALAWLVGILAVAHTAAIAAYRRKTG
ncbi:ABC transporter permease [Isoptericola rhizosphaerae]|uniref:ABC transporter permease n=1 Tax=Isoptericola rhizosphaerae TaxID=3377837 RepID=UPI00383BF155